MRHKKHSDIPDGDDATLIRPSDWNDDHVLPDPTDNLYKLEIVLNQAGQPTIQLTPVAGGATFLITANPEQQIVKGMNGSYYRIVVDADGNIGTELI